MIIIVHNKAKKVDKVYRENEIVETRDTSCTATLWEVAENFPEELIVWVEKKFQEHLNFSNFENIFHHDLIMASYAVESAFLPPALGYIDQSPFINLNRKLTYGTWQMSSDIGGIKAEVLLKFKTDFSEIENLDYLLNSVAKVGQQNGLFCYSEPALIKSPPQENPKYRASTAQLFSFVFQHYKTPWTYLLFRCFSIYEKKKPFLALAQSFFNTKYFQLKIDLSDIKVQSKKVVSKDNTIDVIIPTMGRPQHLLQVLGDLSRQSLLPKKIVVIEQNPDDDSVSDFDFSTHKYPFEVIHEFIHQTGACNARNLALEKVDADWVFFCDDDNRFGPDLLENSLLEMKRYGTEVLNLSYLQKGEKEVFTIAKQWSTFGAGNAILNAKMIENVRFSPIFEHGYGEDRDFGMQLRNKGVDIIYHPNIEILHLKAPMGGFRQKIVKGWEKEEFAPKPSPTIMAFAKLYYTQEQINGYKTSLFIKFYSKQKIKNPFKYNTEMQQRWKISERWAKKLIKEHS